MMFCCIDKHIFMILTRLQNAGNYRPVGNVAIFTPSALCSASSSIQLGCFVVCLYCPPGHIHRHKLDTCRVASFHISQNRQGPNKAHGTWHQLQYMYASCLNNSAHDRIQFSKAAAVTSRTRGPELGLW